MTNVLIVLAREYFEILEASPLIDDLHYERFCEIMEAAEKEPKLQVILDKIDYDYFRRNESSE